MPVLGEWSTIRKLFCPETGLWEGERTLPIISKNYGHLDTMNSNSFCFSQVRFRFVSVGFVCEKCAKSARPHLRVSGRCPADCRSVANATRTSLGNPVSASVTETSVSAIR